MQTNAAYDLERFAPREQKPRLRVAGQRQAYVDALNAATDLAAVDAIAINYTAPGA